MHHQTVAWLFVIAVALAVAAVIVVAIMDARRK
jgi:hypothetical protein